MHLHDNHLFFPQVKSKKRYPSGISSEQDDMIYLRTSRTTNLDHLAPVRTILDHKGPFGPHDQLLVKTDHRISNGFVLEYFQIGIFWYTL